MMTAHDKDYKVLYYLERVAPDATLEDARILRRAERTLQRWGEEECGNSNDHCSWCIVRDEETDKPYREVHPHRGESRREPIADRETGALKRIKAVCERLGINYYHQGDPRGCALYVSKMAMNGSNYSSNGIEICA